MVRKEGGKGKVAVNRTRSSLLPFFLGIIIAYLYTDRHLYTVGDYRQALIWTVTMVTPTCICIPWKLRVIAKYVIDCVSQESCISGSKDSSDSDRKLYVRLEQDCN